jgi:hypothetical protein
MKSLCLHCLAVVAAAVVAGSGALAAPAAKQGGGVRRLSPPVEQRSLETLEPAPAALHVGPDRVVMVPAGKGIGVVAPFHGAGATREAVFGKLTDGQRLPVAPDAPGRPWRGLDEVGNKILLLDGEDLTMLEADAKTLKEVTRRTIPRDLLRPARDPRGEPTGPVTAALRQKFKAAFLATPPPRITGMARLPEGWAGDAKKRRYALATRVPGFPLLTMACDLEEPSSCSIERQCHLEGAADLAPQHVTGVAVSAADKTILIGDDGRQRVVGFTFHSCYDVARRQEWALPEKLKTLSSLAVDGAGRLWIGTAQADDYLNASLFFWAPDDWR